MTQNSTVSPVTFFNSTAEHGSELFRLGRDVQFGNETFSMPAKQDDCNSASHDSL